MVDGESPDWLPPGFTQKFKYKNGRKIKYYHNVATGINYHSKKAVINSATTENIANITPQTNNDDNGRSSNNKVDTILAKTNDSPDPLPNGWIVEERIRKGVSKGSTYKVYTESSSGSKFYSRVAVDRYLKSVHPADTTGQQNKLDNVDEPLPDMSLQLSVTSAGPVTEKKRKEGSFKPVDCVSTPADGLPPGWIKEMIISKSGKKIRSDPYYTDPASGYVFRSKPDALRFLKNGDIKYCASKPKRKEDLQLIKNEIPSSCPDNGSASEDLQTKALFPDEEINGGVENSLTKVQSNSHDNESDDAKVTFAGSNSLEMNKTCENLNTNAEKENNTEHANEVSKQDSPRTVQKLPESEIDNQTHKAQLGSRKSKKRKEPSLPSRASKRLAKCEPEVLNESALKAAAKNSTRCEVDRLPILPLNGPASVPDPIVIERAVNDEAKNSTSGEVDTFANLPLNGPGPVLNERAVNDEAKNSTGGEVDTFPNLPLNGPGPVLSERALKPAAISSTGGEVDTFPNLPLNGPGPVLNERALNDAAINSTGGEVDTFPNLPLNGPTSISPPKEENPSAKIQPSNETENQLPIEDQVIQEEQKQVDSSQKSELCYGFDGSWSDPCLEFAFKTLTGEIPIEDTLVFSGRFENQTKPPQSDVPNTFQTEVDPHPESSKAVDQLPANASMFGFANFSGVKSQNSFTEAANRDRQKNVNR